ncbi:M14 family metallopeptidase [Cellulophaga fucicola]|uniref:Zinc carboxypeptidase n=1 Tax=Cellulophaga fucicola TaxID=76595 RepID=A0A1K1MAM9_9FLAO|nr:M14 family metallopeptidase [Cellulophaga fucicola]SFW20149.1 Zinc carboxypeptidase [Cellulophaga fucicola]
MKLKLQYLLLGCICFASTSTLFAQQNYQTTTQLTSNLKSLVSKHKSNAKLTSLIKTLGGKDIWVLTLSKGNPDNNPAMVVVGGVQGNYLLGTELAIKFAENVLTNNKSVLDNTTFYIFPNMSPDATEQYFSKLKYERQGNAKKTDDDRDGQINEDAYEDLNKDGLITLMRIQDPTGDYMMLEEDNRIMVKADTNKGEKGTYKVFTEGIDNDKDGAFNEDGEGGVHFNKNFTYNSPYFKPGAGEHAVSELENRAMLDFLYEKWNVYSIFSFGPANNLSEPLKYSASNAKKRVVTSVLKNDAKLNKQLSEKYNELIPNKNAPASITNGGGFFEWSYFHFGRLALSTPAWWAPEFKGDSINKAPKNRDANFLKWAEQEDVTNAFVDWKEISHPDFPNNKVEVGGIAPFVQNNPPYKMVDSIAQKHNTFILDVVKMQPSLLFTNLKQEKLGSGLTRITVDLHNQGLLPTQTEMGAKSRWLRKINVALDLGNGQKIISGKQRQLITKIDEDGTSHFTWLINGKGKLVLKAGAPQTGTQEITINL